MTPILPTTARIPSVEYKVAWIRKVGGALSGWCLALTKLQHEEVSWLQIFVLVVLWGVVAWCGVKSRLLFSLLGKRQVVGRLAPSWTGVAVSVPLVTGMAAILILPKGAIPPFLFALSVSISVIYIFSKLGCVLKGCCGAQIDVSWISRSGLPFFEILYTLVFLAIQLFLALGNMYYFSLLLFVVSHSILRLLAYLLRCENMSSSYSIIAVKSGASMAAFTLVFVLALVS